MGRKSTPFLLIPTWVQFSRRQSLQPKRGLNSRNLVIKAWQRTVLIFTLRREFYFHNNTGGYIWFQLAGGLRIGGGTQHTVWRKRRACPAPVLAGFWCLIFQRTLKCSSERRYQACGFENSWKNSSNFRTCSALFKRKRTHEAKKAMANIHCWFSILPKHS